MIRLHLLIAVLAVMFIWPLQLAGSTDVSAPGNTYDFGTVKQGTKIVHAFAVDNNTALPLTIQSVELSMPGMKARFKPVVNPGTEGSINLEWDTTHVSGEIEGQGIVHFADDSRRVMALLLKGVVKPPLEILPFPAIFLSAFQGENNEQRLRIVNNEARPVNVTLSQSASKHLLASLVTVQPGRVYELTARIASGALPGRYDEELSLSTGDPEIGSLTIPVHLFVKAELYANPDVVDFGQVSADQLRNNPAIRSFLTQTFLLKKREGNFEITKIASDVPGIEISQDPAHQESSTYRIDVALNPQKIRLGKLEGWVEIETTAEGFRRIKVPVRGDVF